MSNNFIGTPSPNPKISSECTVAPRTDLGTGSLGTFKHLWSQHHSRMITNKTIILTTLQCSLSSRSVLQINTNSNNYFYILMVLIHSHEARVKLALVQRKDILWIDSWWNRTSPPWKRVAGTALYQTFCYKCTKPKSLIGTFFLHINTKWKIYHNKTFLINGLSFYSPKEEL